MTLKEVHFKTTFNHWQVLSSKGRRLMIWDISKVSSGIISVYVSGSQRLSEEVISKRCLTFGKVLVATVGGR